MMARVGSQIEEKIWLLRFDGRSENVASWDERRDRTSRSVSG